MRPLPEQTSDHWWRPGVRPDRRLLVWHILFGDQPQVAALAEICRARLKGIPGLDLVPEQWLHMTTQIVGFGDEISDAEQADMVVAATETGPLTGGALHVWIGCYSGGCHGGRPCEGGLLWFWAGGWLAP